MNEQSVLEQLARHRRAMQAAAGILNKTGLCSPKEAAEIGQMLWEVANADTEEETAAATRALEDRAGY